jgi:hypothetical protein
MDGSDFEGTLVLEQLAAIVVRKMKESDANH